MLVKPFLAWMEIAPVRDRAEAVATLARAYLAGAMGEDSPREVEAALSTVLDDPSPVVRRALAFAFADRADAPRHLVLNLAADQPEVSGLLIARSPILTEADLIDLALTGEKLTLMGIALRADVTPRVAHALAARADLDSAFALVGNGASRISEPDLLAIVAKFGDRPRLREAMLARGDLPPSVRHVLMQKVAATIGGFVAEGGFLNPARKARIVEETVQSGAVAIARRSGPALPGYVAHLRADGQLTPALLLRSVLGGDLDFMAAALADLCRLDRARVAGMLGAKSEPAIAALLRRAGIPAFLEATLVAAIRAAARLPAGGAGDLALPVIHAAQTACAATEGEEGLRLMALLRRCEAEAARQAARTTAESLRREAIRPAPAITTDAAASLLPPAIGPDMLRLGGIHPDEDESESGGENGAEALTPAMRRSRGWGLVLDEPIPELATLIAEWKAEHAAADRARAADLMRSGNQNDKPGRSRVA